MISFNAVQKSSTPQIVAEQILAQIDAGTLKPGHRLPSQRDLAQQLEVGRSSVREAVNALVVMGHLEVRQGSGTYVRQDPPVADASMQRLASAFEAVGLVDLMEARELLESRSAALAAERAGTDVIAELKKILQQVEATREEYGVFLKADIAFHDLIARATGNPVIEEMTRLVLDKVVTHHKRLKTDKLSAAYRAASIDSARQVVKAVISGDSEGAARWMGIHLRAIRHELKDIL